MPIFKDFQGGAIRLTQERLKQKGDGSMAKKIIKLWYDREGDYLEVIFDKKPGYFRETQNDQVMEKVDSRGNVLGFSIIKVSKTRRKPLDVVLT